MILLTSDTPTRVIPNMAAFLEAREAAFTAWRDLAPAHFLLALAFRGLAYRRQLAGCR